jgi:hypothetical protein
MLKSGGQLVSILVGKVQYFSAPDQCSAAAQLCQVRNALGNLQMKLFFYGGYDGK